mmetsp:Transcript_89334/g.276513  ORF Transcript_89334/g.276513 Transcript_89334/m.276513 type:complete len:204 (+) Transcript_89334:988-1599(+)
MLSRTVRASASGPRAPTASKTRRSRSAESRPRAPSSEGARPYARSQRASAVLTSDCARQPSTTVAYIEARAPPAAPPSRSRRSRTMTARPRSRALTQHVTRQDQTMRVGTTPCMSLISRATRWQARSRRPARERSFTKMEKVTLLGLTLRCLISVNKRRPSCKSPAFTQPSNSELYTISSHSSSRAWSSSASLIALLSSPLLQ